MAQLRHELPGTRPCDCEHEYFDHHTDDDDFEKACDLCGCRSYRPIPRSELRRRLFDRARAEAKLKAETANRTEQKSQEFPTSTEESHRYWVALEWNWRDVVNAVDTFGIVVGEHPVVDNGPEVPHARFLTYKTVTGAENGLRRVRVELDDARIVEYDRKVCV